MDIKIYIGGHRTSTTHFAAVLAKNIDYLSSENIAYATSTRRTFKRIYQAVNAIKTGSGVEEIQEDFLPLLTLGSDAKNLLIVDTKLIGSGNRPFSKTFYGAKAGAFFKDLQILFKGHNIRLYTETRNLATLMMSAYSESIASGDFKNFEAYLTENDLNEFRWSTFIHRIQSKGGVLPCTIWRYEDYQYTWRDIIGAFTGVSNVQDLVGVPELESSGLSFRSAQLFNKYMEENPDIDADDITKAKEIFLKKFPNTAYEETDLYWPPEQIENFKHSYDDDWYYINRMENIEVIRPRLSRVS